MPGIKLNIGDVKSGKTVMKEIAEDNVSVLVGLKIGDKLDGAKIGHDGYEFEITGGSDHCGFPMRPDVDGSLRKRVLSVGGVGIRNNKTKGRRVRKLVAGNTVHDRTAQVNVKVLKYGKSPLETAAEAPADGGDAPAEGGDAKADEAAPAKEEKKEAPKDAAKDAPKEGAKEEAKDAAKKDAPAKDDTKEEKKD